MTQIPQIDYATPPSQVSNGLSLASMVVGIVSIVTLCAFWFVCLPVALTGLILGIVALRKIRKGTQRGKAMAITGISCSTVSLVVAAAMIGVTIWLFTRPAFRAAMSSQTPATGVFTVTLPFGPTTPAVPPLPSPPSSFPATNPK